MVNRVLTYMASTRGVLVAIGASMAVIAVTTLTNPNLDLPGENFLAGAAAIGAASGLVGGLFFSEPSSPARAVAGAMLCLISLIRGVAFAVAIERRTDGVVDALKQYNPVAMSFIAAMLGFLVWARSTDPPHSGKVGN